jgi:hypothetical protein
MARKDARWVGAEAAEHVLAGTRGRRMRKGRRPKLRWLQRLLAALAEMLPTEA